jgi:hypothetical protein
MLNWGARAVIASPPPPPEPKVEGAVSTDTTLTWASIQAAATYKVWWRRTDSNQWQISRIARATECREIPPLKCETAICTWTYAVVPSCKMVLPHIRVDDWVFGVSSMSKDGFESPVASAVPGGAFHPYIAPPKK